jgi:hypothetical protein
MKKRAIPAWVACLVISVSLVTGCMEGAYSTVNVSGTVAARELDPAGKPATVEIKNGPGPGVRVNNSGKGKEPTAMVDRKVEVKGTVFEEKGVKQITVVSYKVVE